MRKKCLVITLIFLISAFFISGVFALESSVYDTVRNRVITAYSSGGTIKIEVFDSSGAPVDGAELEFVDNPETVTTNSLGDNFSLSYNADQAYISFTDDASEHTTVVKDLTPLSAPGGSPVLYVNPTTLNFGTVDVGSSTTSNVQVQNIGTANLNVTFVGSFTPSVFSLNSNGCTSPVAPQATCNISVRFTPTADTTYSGSFQINSDGGNQSVTLNGTGRVVGGGGGSIDLQATYISAGSSIYKNGSNTIQYRIKNNGSDSSGTFKVRIYLSPCIDQDGMVCLSIPRNPLDDGKTVNAPDYILETTTHTSLSSGAETPTITTTVTNPGSLRTHGTYYYIVMADPDNEISETNESNNTKYRGGVVP